MSVSMDKQAVFQYEKWREYFCGLSAEQLQLKYNQPHWIISSDGYYPYCSECKSEPKDGEMTDFCPNCGADMRKGSGEM